MTSRAIGSAEKPAQASGRPPKKMVERYRSSMWATLLKLESQLTWEVLDAQLLVAQTASVASDPQDADGKLLRVVHRIYKRGDSPVGVKLDGKGEPINLVTVAAERFGQAGAVARQAYESPLWALLADPRTQTREHAQVAIAGSARRLGIATIDPEVAETFMLATGRRLPNRGNHTAIRQAAHLVAELEPLDALVVLGVQARFALDRFAFGELDIYIDAIRNATHRFCDLLADNFLPRGIETLIYQRLILRDWQEVDPRWWSRANILSGEEMRSDPTRVRGKQWMQWAGSNDRYQRLWICRDEGYPIVHASEQIDWLHANAGLLHKSATRGLLGDAVPADHPDLLLSPEEDAAFRAARNLWSDSD